MKYGGYVMEGKLYQFLENLKALNKKNIQIRQKGFIQTQFPLEKMEYQVQSDIVRMEDETHQKWIQINLNQVYDVELEKEIRLFLDNDTIIEIENRDV